MRGLSMQKAMSLESDTALRFSLSPRDPGSRIFEAEIIMG